MEDTANVKKGIKKLFQVVDTCPKVEKKGRERHVQIWDCFIENNAKAPKKPKTCLTKGRRMRRRRSWRIPMKNLKTARPRSWFLILLALA